jgi:hypothetical protein
MPEPHEKAAAAFIAATRPHHKRLVDAATHGMADTDCDLVAGDTYDPAEYATHAEAAVSAVLYYLAWTEVADRYAGHGDGDAA